MSKFSTKAVLVFVVILALALAVGVVGAQDDTVDPRGNGQGQRDGGFRNLIGIVVEQTGLTVQEIITQVREGVTLADVITNNGGSVDAVVDEILANAETRMSEAVANERITQEQMDERLATLEETVNAALNGEFEPRGNGECQLPDGDFPGGQGFGGNENGNFPGGNGQGGNSPRGNGNGQFPDGNGQGGQGGNGQGGNGQGGQGGNGQGGQGPCSITAETDV